MATLIIFLRWRQRRFAQKERVGLPYVCVCVIPRRKKKKEWLLSEVEEIYHWEALEFGEQVLYKKSSQERPRYEKKNGELQVPLSHCVCVCLRGPPTGRRQNASHTSPIHPPSNTSPFSFLCLSCSPCYAGRDSPPNCYFHSHVLPDSSGLIDRRNVDRRLPRGRGHLQVRSREKIHAVLWPILLLNFSRNFRIFVLLASCPIDRYPARTSFTRLPFPVSFLLFVLLFVSLFCSFLRYVWLSSDGFETPSGAIIVAPRTAEVFFSSALYALVEPLWPCYTLSLLVLFVLLSKTEVYGFPFPKKIHCRLFMGFRKSQRYARETRPEG